MAVNAFTTIRSAIAKDLQDSTYTYWTEDEIDAWINEAQRDYAFHAKCLKAQTVISAKENIETYNFPNDYLEFIRMEDESGNDIVPTSWKSLLEEYGNNYRATTGTPENIYADLDGEGQFRFYPRPTTAIDSTPTAMTPYALQEMNWTGGYIYGMYSAYGIIYVVDATYIYVYEGEVSALTLQKRIAHGQTITGNVVRMVIASPLDRTVITTPTLFWTIGTKMYTTVLNTGVTTLFGTASATIQAMGGFGNGGRSDYLSYAITGGIASTPSDSFSETIEVVTTVYQMTYYQGTGDGTVYAACDTKLYSIAPGGTPAEITISGVTSFKGVCANEVDGLLYVRNSSGGITSYNCVTGVVTALTTENIIAAASELVFDGTYIWGYKTALSITQVSHSDGSYRSFVETSASSSGVSTLDYAACGNDGIFYWAGSIISILSSDNEVGDVVYYGGTISAIESGIFADYEDTDNVIVFESDEGAVTTVYESSTAYPLWYARYPREDELEITNTKALKYYVMWKAYLRDGDTQNMPKAKLNFQLYQDQLGDAFQTRSKGYLSGNQTRPKVNFY